MLDHTEKFNSLLGVKSAPNNHEKGLFERAQYYIKKLQKIPGIEMIAIGNSLSMYATHPDSDIDLFIIASPGMIWLVRFLATLILWENGVWRKDGDIAGNFCLSFFITTEAMDLSKIAIRDDIYLAHWIYHLKPIYISGTTYERFLSANTAVIIDEEQKKENLRYLLTPMPLENLRANSGGVHAMKLYKKINTIIRYFFLPKTQRSAQKLGNPEGVVISDTMLKFHDQDQRKIIRDTILKNSFDK